MIEAIAVPLLVKAIDFLFDESRKILEERRMRRQTETENMAKKDEQKAEHLPASDQSAQLPQINAKQMALITNVDEVRWRNSEKELTHLLELCEIYRTNLYNAKEKYARFGRDYAPSYLLHEINEYEDGFLDATNKVNKLLSYIYEKEIIIST